MPVVVMAVVVEPTLVTLDTLVYLTVYFFSLNFDSKISNFDYFSTFHQNCNSILVTLIIFS